MVFYHGSLNMLIYWVKYQEEGTGNDSGPPGHTLETPFSHRLATVTGAVAGDIQREGSALTATDVPKERQYRLLPAGGIGGPQGCQEKVADRHQGFLSNVSKGSEDL